MWTTDGVFPNGWKVFECCAAESSLFWLGTVCVMGNLSDIVGLLILWRFDALFGCGGANGGDDACSRGRWSPAFRCLCSV